MSDDKKNGTRFWSGFVQTIGLGQTTGIRDLTLKQYRKLLSRLPIKNPSHEDMARLCPHLTREEAIAAFTTGSGYVALPPLRVKGAFQIVSYRAGYTNPQGETYPARLSWAFAGLTQRATRYKHMQRAVSYAEQHWGDRLIDKAWTFGMELVIEDPSRLTRGFWSRKANQPKYIATVYLALIDRQDCMRSAPKPFVPDSQCIDLDTIDLTTDAFVGAELHAGCRSYSRPCCAYCGGGLGLGGCGNCNHRFQDSESRVGWFTPLPQKAVDLLRGQKHVFRQDPSIASMRELKEFQARAA